jgi:flagellar hook-associated protein 1 FlgK
MQFQQAYQASAKTLQVAQRVFDTMLQELGR